MEDLDQLKATNKRAAARELAELRRDTVKGLRYALKQGGVDAVIDLLAESDTLCPVFDAYADNGATVDGLVERERTTQDIVCPVCGGPFATQTWMRCGHDEPATCAEGENPGDGTTHEQRRGSGWGTT